MKIDQTIPKHLQGQPQTESGLVIPWVAMWSEEQGCELKCDSNLGSPFDKMPAVFTDQHVGQGEPVLGKMDPWRQRHVILQGKCQVCQARLPERFRWLVMIQNGAMAFAGGEVVYPITREPFVCDKCLVYSLSSCPGIARRDAAEQEKGGMVPIILAHTWRIILSWIDENGLKELNCRNIDQAHEVPEEFITSEHENRVGAICYLKIMPVSGRSFSREQILDLWEEGTHPATIAGNIRRDRAEYERKMRDKAKESLYVEGSSRNGRADG